MEAQREVSKGAKIRNRYNKVPHLTQSCLAFLKHFFVVSMNSSVGRDAANKYPFFFD